MSRKYPNLSLLDTCLGYLIEHPEIVRIDLPGDLQDHLLARAVDPRYRVKPPYNESLELNVEHQLHNYMTQLEQCSDDKIQERAKTVMSMFNFITEHRYFMEYRPKFARIVRDKLYEFYFHQPRAQLFYRDWNGLHRDLFNSDLRFHPPQCSYGIRKLHPVPPDHPVHPVHLVPPVHPVPPVPPVHPVHPVPLVHPIPLDPLAMRGLKIKLPMESLTHETITLRPFNLTDAAALVEISSDPNVQVNIPVPRNLEEAHEFIQFSQQEWEAGQSSIWAILVKASDQLIGCIGLFQLDLTRRYGQVGYWMDSRIHRQDLGIEAVDLITHWAITQLYLTDLEMMIDPTNDYLKHTIQAVGYNLTVDHKINLEVNQQPTVIYSFRL